MRAPWLAAAIIGILAHPGVCADLAPAAQVRLVNTHLSARRQAGEDTTYYRALSFYATPRDDLDSEKRFARAWLQFLSTSQYPAYPIEIAGGRVWLLDLRDYNWNAAAWRAMAVREPFHTEPAVPADLANKLREYIGEEQDAATHHVIGIVRADWFLRETFETQRSPAYYDLLFANQRYVASDKGGTENRTVNHPGGDFRYPDGQVAPNVAKGTYVIDVPSKKGVKFVDFPKDEDDWNNFFGITDTRSYLKKVKVDTRHGAIVPGARDDKNGSIVAWHNRIYEITPITTGVAMKVFDTDLTANTTDYVEHAEDALDDKLDFKAGELLASLPNGAQAGLLINGQKKRIEKGDPEFVRNSLDGSYVDVRNFMGCVICHAPQDGVIVSRNLYKEAAQAGVLKYFKSKDRRNRMDGFYLDWEFKVEGWRKPYAMIIEKSTRDQPPPRYLYEDALAAKDDDWLKSLILQAEKASRSKGWTGAQFASTLVVIRDRYDAPITTAQAALELGIPPEVLVRTAADSPNGRINLLGRGVAIPRSVWDTQVFQEAARLYLTDK